MTCNAASAAVGSPGWCPISPLPSGTTGERMFVLNPTSEQALDPSVLGWALEQVKAAGGKAAWLCSSHSEADILQAILGVDGHPVYRLRAGDDTAVDGWSRSHQGQLITAGRYDGLDFPGDVCKLVIITTVP
jgi:Rad3-related DNA helicase